MRKILLLLLLCAINSVAQESSRKMIDKEPDKNNQKVISRYNRYYFNSNIAPGFMQSPPPSRWCYTAIFGVNPNSTMSNEDIEVNVVKNWVANPVYNDQEDRVYFIVIKNKTRKALYIDKGYCFKVFNDGSRKPYYDLQHQTDSNQQQRYIVIPPRSKKNLTDYRWDMSKSVNYPEILEYPEDFQWSAAEANVGKGFVENGGEISFTENTSLYHRSFLITYSDEKDFSTYSMVKINFYIRQIIGIYYPELNKDYKLNNSIHNADEHTITSCEVIY